MALWLRKKKKDLAPWEMGPPVNFSAISGTSTENQAHMIKARQSMGIVSAKELMADALNKRAERVMLDYTREGVAVRYDVDGVWHQAPSLALDQGNLMLAVLKVIAFLNPDERRARQQGKFAAEYAGVRYRCTLISQGTKTGERVVIQMAAAGHKFSKLEELGMRDAMRDQFKELINRDRGLIIFSAPPLGGLKTIWNVGLGAADRYMRDFVAVEDKNKVITDVENVEVETYDAAAGETPDAVIKKLILRQPDVFCVPEPGNAESIRLLCQHVNEEEKMACITVRAKEAAEALVRALMLKPPVKEFAKAVICVLNTRLVRRLCPECKQPFEPHPQLLKKLGFPPDRKVTFYREYQPPPPGQAAKSKDEPEICPTCDGIGYHGRIGLFELLVVDDGVRAALVKRPKLDVLRQAARKAGCRSLQEEGVLQVALGATSLTELQRVLRQ